MLRDADGRLHLAIAVFGPWSRTLDHDLRWLSEWLPPRFARSTKVIDSHDVWYLNVQVLLPAEHGRPEPVQLHVSAMTGAVWSLDLGRFLVEHADGVIFAAETSRHRLAHACEAHEALRAWRPAHVVYQLDESAEEVERVPLEELRARLSIGEAPCFATRAVEGREVNAVFRDLVARLLAAPLGERPLATPVRPLP